VKGSEKLLPKAPMKGRVKVPSSPPDLDGADARLRQPCGFGEPAWPDRTDRQEKDAEDP